MRSRLCPRHRRAFGAASVVVLVAALLATSMTGSSSAQGGEWIQVSASLNTVLGDGWTDGATVTLEIDDPATVPAPDFTASQVVSVDSGPAGLDFQFFGVPYDIKTGDVVSVTDGTTTKVHTALAVDVVSADTVADTLSGTAEPNLALTVSVLAPNFATIGVRHVSADGSGNWTADFSTVGAGLDEQDIVDLVPGQYGTAASEGVDDGDDGDRSGHSIVITGPPMIMVSQQENTVVGDNWINGSTVTVEIDDPATIGSPDYTDSQTVAADSGPTGIDFQFFVGGGYDIKENDVVSVSDGSTTKVHVVEGLAITSVDQVTDVVSGVAVPNTTVTVAALTGSFSPLATRHVMADGAGNWSANFAVVGAGPDEQTIADIMGGQWVSARGAPDVDGDLTYHAQNTGFSGPIVSIVQAASVYEGDAGKARAMKFAVTLSEPATETVTVGYRINVGGSASSPEDFASTSGYLTFKPSASTGKTPTTKFLTAKIQPDLFPEGVEYFEAVLSSVTGGGLGIAGNAATGVIFDDDPAGPDLRVSVGNARIWEGDLGSTFSATNNAAVSVSLSAPATTTVSVQITVAGGSATENSDFRPFVKTVTFKPGQYQKFVPIKVRPDYLFEGEETVVISLSNPSAGLSIGNANGTLWIADDD